MAEAGVLRAMSYNIRACLGIDGTRSPERIAGVIEAEVPDVVALQEVDTARDRSQFVDQSRVIADLLGMWSVAPPSFHEGDGGYGNAVLSRLPARLERHGVLPHVEGTEPRAAMAVLIEHAGAEVRLVNTHLSFRRADRPLQIDELLDAGWLGEAHGLERTILCGDLNCSPRDRGYKKLRGHLSDVQVESDGRAKTTWPTRRPFRRIDHVLVSRDWEVLDAYVSRRRPAGKASDHFPVVAALRLVSDPSICESAPGTPPPSRTEGDGGKA